MRTESFGDPTPKQAPDPHPEGSHPGWCSDCEPPKCEWCGETGETVRERYVLEGNPEPIHEIRVVCCDECFGVQAYKTEPKSVNTDCDDTFVDNEDDQEVNF